MKANSEYEVGEYEFQQWMKKYWGGAQMEWYEDAGEYRGFTQMAWEIWKRFFPKEYPTDVKLWSMFQGARYKEGELIEEYDHGFLSSCGPTMVEYEDYAALHKHCQELQQRLDSLIQFRKEEL